jgi:hypothetical protein
MKPKATNAKLKTMRFGARIDQSQDIWEPDEPVNEDDLQDWPEVNGELAQHIANKFDVVVSFDVRSEGDDEYDDWQMSVVLHNPTASQMSAVEAYVHKNAHMWLQEKCLQMDYSKDDEDMYSLEVTVTADEGVIRPKPELRSLDEVWL